MTHEPEQPVVLLHAINGTGLGHLSRQTALARHLRGHYPSLKPVILAECTAAPDICTDIPFVQIPSTDDLRRLGRTDVIAHDLLRCKISMCMSVVESLRPTLVVHDTMVWNPLASVARLVGARQALALRPRRDIDSYLQQADCPVHFMDLIFVPDSREDYPDFAEALEAAGLAPLWTGPLIRPVEDSPHRVRRRLGLSPERALLVATTGGGSGDDSRSHLEFCLNACARITHPELTVLLITGPLLTGSIRVPPSFPHELHVLRITPHLQDLLAAADVVMCRGGYGSLNEAARGGAAVFAAAAERKVDDQKRRVQQWTRRKENYVLFDMEHPIEDLTAKLTAALSNPPRQQLHNESSSPAELTSRLNYLALSASRHASPDRHV